jgi:hypothetical protein
MYSSGLAKVCSRSAELGVANDLSSQKEAKGMFLSICLISGTLISHISDETLSSD